MAISESECAAAVAVRRSAIYALQERNGFRAEQRVRLTAEHRRLFPKAKMRRDMLFARGTEARIKFDELRHPMVFDEGFFWSRTSNGEKKVPRVWAG